MNSWVDLRQNPAGSPSGEASGAPERTSGNGSFRLTRPMAAFGAPFLAAMLAASCLPLYGAGILLFLLAAALLLTCMLEKTEKRLFLRVILSGALAGAACFGGWKLRANFDAQSLAGQTVRLGGTVEEMSLTRSGRMLALRVAVSAHDIPKAPGRFQAIVYLPAETRVELADRLDVQGRCGELSATPDFSLRDYYESEGVSLVLFAAKDPLISSPDEMPLRFWPRLWNRALCERTDRLYPEPYAGLVRAVLLGDRSRMDDGIYGAFTRAGITHIFAVSGMHVSLMAGLALLLLKGFPPRTRALGGCLAVWLFAALTGFGLPALRAGVMMTVLLSGQVIGRPADPLNSLFLAGVLLTGFAPWTIRSGSFQLSMTAALGVILLAGPIGEAISCRTGFSGRIGRGVCGLLGCSLGANLIMLPVVWRLFSGISLVFPLSNLLAVPLLWAVMPLAALSLAMPLPAVSTLFVWLTEGLLWLLWKTAELLSGSPFFYLGLDSPLVPVWMLFGGIAAGLALLAGRKRFASLSVLCAVLLAAGSMGVESFLNRETLVITPVYSFEGVSLILQQGSRATIVALADGDTVDQTLESRLRSRNVRRIENLVLCYGPPASLSDTAFLTEVFLPDRVFALPEDGFCRSVGDLLGPGDGCYPLADGRGYDISTLDGEGLIEVYRRNGEVMVRAELGGTRVGITGSSLLAGRIDCEILFYAGTDLRALEEIPLRRVILLARPDHPPDPLPSGVAAAYEEGVTLCLDKTGKFRIKTA